MQDKNNEEKEESEEVPKDVELTEGNLIGGLVMELTGALDSLKMAYKDAKQLQKKIKENNK